jgi:hypothetical protein
MGQGIFPSNVPARRHSDPIPLLLPRYSKLQRSVQWYTAGELAELALIVG